MADEPRSSALAVGQELAQSIAVGASRGGVPGAVLSAAGTLLKKKNRKWLYVVLTILLLPTLLEMLLVYGIFSSSNSFSSVVEGQAQEAVSVSGVSAANYDAYENAANSYDVPWEVLAAIAYYESGPGYGAGEAIGSCPPGQTPWTEAYCPSVGAPSLGASTAAGAPAQACLPGSATPFSWSKPGKFSWTVPSGASALRVVLVGGAGGGPRGGPGGSVQACLHVPPGQKLTLYVGAAGQTGSGGPGYSAGGAGHFGGGGSSAVVSDGGLLAEAGGGGGSSPTSAGGAGGSPAGTSGSPGNAVLGARAGGGGGATQASPGCSSGPVEAKHGPYVKGGCGQGGTGGPGSSYDSRQFGGGGGGGYKGGGGGSTEVVEDRGSVVGESSSGGGGGSSWVAAGVTDVTYSTQAGSGNGEIEISYSSGSGPFGLTPAAGLSSAQEGDLATVSIYLARRLSDALAQQPQLGRDDNVGFLADESASSDGFTVDPSSWGQVQTKDAFVNALAQLPISGNSRALDTNIYELATDWGLGQSPPGSAALSTNLVCGSWSGGSMLVAGPLGAGVELSQQQMDNAVVIAQVGRQMGLPDVALQIAIGTALTESSLWDLPNGSVPGSESDPYVQWGSYTPSNPPDNGTSVGLFQQQVGIWDNGTATVTEAMDPTWSAQSFYSVLESVPGWQSATSPSEMGAVAQAVQRSADPGRYQGWMPAAATILGAVLNIPCQGTLSATGKAAQVIAAAERFVGNTPYVWGGGGPSGPSGSAIGPAGYVGKPGFDCSGLVQYALAQVGIMVPHYSGDGGQFSVVQAAGGFTTDISQLQPGDLVFFVGVGDGGSVTNPGHVGIYIGNDEMVDAPYTGALVSIDPITASTAGGFVGGGPAW